jgi:alpha-beta hydrolase superfamily lysophospholipase
MTAEQASAVREERIKAADGIELFVRSWRPTPKARGVVAICPGFNSHSGHYVWAAEQLRSAGFAVYAVDLRGRGRSDGERYYVKSFSEYESDLASLVSLARSREPGLPLFLLGHSAGGVISCAYALYHQGDVAGLICESFAFRVPAPDFALAVFKGLSHVAPHAHVLKLHNEYFSRDAAWVKTLNEDTLIAHEVQPTLTLAEMVRADEKLEKDFHLIRLPLLILHGTADKVTVPDGSQLFYETAGSKDRTINLYQGHYHDLLNDTGREKVMTDIVGWMEQRLPVAVQAGT